MFVCFRTMNFDCVVKEKISWKKITAENLDTDYASQFLPRNTADTLFNLLQKDVEYFSGDLAQVRIFGKWHPIPRQQVFLTVARNSSLVLFCYLVTTSTYFPE